MTKDREKNSKNKLDYICCVFKQRHKSIKSPFLSLMIYLVIFGQIFHSVISMLGSFEIPSRVIAYKTCTGPKNLIHSAKIVEQSEQAFMRSYWRHKPED